MSQNRNKDISEISIKDISIPKLKILSELIRMKIEKPDLLEKMDRFKRFFYKKLVKDLLIIINMTTSRDHEYLDIAKVIVKQLTRLLAKNLKNKTCFF